MKKYWVPLIVGVSMAVGMIVGSVYTVRHKVLTTYEQMAGFRTSSDNKISEMLRLIDDVYVDSVVSDSISEAILPLIVKQLDPHSAYIPAADLEAVNEQLEGSFSGIGVQFSLQNDTVYVVDVISGGPSERAGLLDGDRIVEVNDTAFVGNQINNEKVMKKLRGPKGSKVRLGVVRRNTSELLHFDITRGDIPVHSVDVAYMVTPTTGYIAVNKFGANTYNEFLTALAKLKKAHARNVVVDLRGNAGGYMDAALNMLNEFLSNNDLMVYVEGRSYPREESRANGYGSAQNMKIAVLIDEWSASASEIFAGAIQDNDRGIIVGRRSFGKGLVQNQMEFNDGSAVRLTVARYYTPAGRCIQKPYERGKAENYETDLLNRYLHGEFLAGQHPAVRYDNLSHQRRPRSAWRRRHHARHICAARHYRRFALFQSFGQRLAPLSFCARLFGTASHTPNQICRLAIACGLSATTKSVRPSGGLCDQKRYFG